MANINENYQKLPGSYLFAEIARRVAAYTTAHPDKKLIKLGIGDVTQPLCPAVIEAMHKAVDEMGSKETFRGYGPEQGYDFLREAIRQNDFLARGADIAMDEIFVSDGAKSDCGNIGISSRGTMWWQSATRCIRFMWIPMPWRAGRGVPCRQGDVVKHLLHAHHCGKRLPAGAAQGSRGHDLSVLSQ